MIRLWAMLVGLALGWSQPGLPCSVEAQSCRSGGCTQCACSKVCCGENGAMPVAPAAPSNHTFPAQLAPSPDGVLTQISTDLKPVFPPIILPQFAAVPLFLRHCAQLI